MKQYYIFIFFMIIFSSFITAYSSSNLLSYYAFEDVNTTQTLNDSRGFKDLKSYHGVFYKSQTGFIGNTINSTDSSVVTTPYFSSNISVNYTKNDFSLNWWSFIISGQDKTIIFSNYSYTIQSWNLANRKSLEWNSATQSGLKNLSSNDYLIHANSSVYSGQWKMNTLTYDKDTGLLRFYRDGILISSNNTVGTQSISNYNYDVISISPLYGTMLFDEFSIWNTTLTTSDIDTLYNSGSGLSYAQTLNNGSDTILIDSNTNVTALHPITSTAVLEDGTTITGVVGADFITHALSVTLSGYLTDLTYDGFVYTWFPSILGTTQVYAYYNLTTTTSPLYYSYTCNYAENNMNLISFTGCNNATDCGFTDNIGLRTNTYDASISPSLLLNSSSSAGAVGRSFTLSNESKVLIGFRYKPVTNTYTRVIFDVDDSFLEDTSVLMVLTNNSENCFYDISTYNYQSMSETLWNKTLITCDTLTSSDVDYYITEIIDRDLEGSASSNSHQYKIVTRADKEYISSVYSNLKATTWQISKFNIVLYDSNSEGFFDDLVFNEIDALYYGWTTTSNSSNILTCQYFSPYLDGRLSRFYYSNNQQFDYMSNHKDFVVSSTNQTLSEDGSVINPSDGSTDNDIIIQGGGGEIGLTTGGKALVIIIILITVLLICYFLGHGAGMSSIGFVTGIVFDVFIVLCASIPTFPLIGGYVPLWIVVISGIIASGIIVIYLRNKTVTTGDGG